MAGFTFQLAPVLRQRELVERDRQREVAELERKRFELEAFLRRMQSGIEQERRDLRERFSGRDRPGVDIGELRVQSNATLFMVGKAQSAAVELAGVLKRLEAARHRLAEAAAARRAMEHLRDTRFDAWRREQARRETAMLDEIGMRRAEDAA
ncbi:MAG: flagellar export protein FliJ [Planctomycetota bacterium]